MKKLTILLLLISLSCVGIASLFCQINSTQNSPTHTVINLHEEKRETRSSQDHLNSFSSVGNVILKFSADWCGPCRRMSDIIKNLLISDLATTMPDFTLININRDHFLDLANTFNITSIPTLIFLHNGTEIKRYDGKPLTKNEFAQLIITTFTNN